MTLGIAADAPVVLCYRVERTMSRAGVAPAEVQRLSRRTFSPTILRVYCRKDGMAHSGATDSKETKRMEHLR